MSLLCWALCWYLVFLCSVEPYADILCGIEILALANIPVFPGRKIHEHASVGLQATFIFMLKCSKE